MRNGFFVETLLNNEIKPIEIGGWANARDWSRKTRNDLLGTLSLLFKDAIKRGFVLANSDDATAIERQKFKCGSLSIMTGKHRRAEDQFKLRSAREDRSGIRGACSEFCRHLRFSSSAQTARVTVSDARKSHLGGRCEASRLALQETKRPARARPQAKLCATDVIVFMFVATKPSAQRWRCWSASPGSFVWAGIRSRWSPRDHQPQRNNGSSPRRCAHRRPTVRRRRT